MKSQWKTSPRLFKNTVEKDIGSLAIKIAGKIYDGVVDLSPVRTGQFRASWHLTKDSIDDSVVVGGSVDSPLSAPTRPTLSNVTYKSKLYITNNHEYGLNLEYGSSKQAPLGMVRITLAKLV